MRPHLTRAEVEAYARRPVTPDEQARIDRLIDDVLTMLLAQAINDMCAAEGIDIHEWIDREMAQIREGT